MEDKQNMNVESGNALFTYIHSKDYNVIINENNVPRVFGRGGIFICLKGGAM